MNLDDFNPRSGTLPAAVAVVVAALCFLVLLGVGIARCSRPSTPVPLVTPHPDPSPAARAIATSSSAATASQTVRVTIRRPVSADHAPQIRSKNRKWGPETQSGSDSPHAPTDFEEIIIEGMQTVSAAANSAATASVNRSPASVNASPHFVNDHGRLGVVALTAPGILAADFQLARLDVPPWLVGIPLELGLDVAANIETAAAGVTIGGKGFAGGYAWYRWDLGAQGLAAGIGLRF